LESGQLTGSCDRTMHQANRVCKALNLRTGLYAVRVAGAHLLSDWWEE
jgi:hypothetical protein